MFRTTRTHLIVPAAVGVLSATSCNWLSLAKNALSYPTIQEGEAANVAAGDSLLYVSMAHSGLAIVDVRTGKELATLAPAPGSESIDDLVIDGPLLFVLDARPPGHVSVYSLGDPLRPHLVAAPREVPVGPFSGISASDGLCIVSGGTSRLTAWRYDSIGALTGPTASADLGRGQPDVLVAPNGRKVYVSTHYWGPYFGIDVLHYDSASRVLSRQAELALDGAGFTGGGAKPANFPIDAAALGGDTVLVAFARGVAIISGAATTRPRVAEVIDVGGSAVNVDTRGSTAAVAVTAPNPMLVILEFAGHQAQVVKRVPLPPGTLLTGVALTAATVAVAARERGVLVFPR